MGDRDGFYVLIVILTWRVVLVYSFSYLVGVAFRWRWEYRWRWEFWRSAEKRCVVGVGEGVVGVLGIVFFGVVGGFKLVRTR